MNLPAIKKSVLSPNIQDSIRSRIGEKAGVFTTSVLDLIGDNSLLQECNPNLVIKEALKAAALDLPINNNLGFAYVIPYKQKGNPVPQFQMGYKGFVQLAIRTGQYRHLNAGVVYEGERLVEDRIKGTLTIEGEKSSDNAIAYFCYMELLNGFVKAIAWDRAKVTAHAKKYSKSYNSKHSPWRTDFDDMALKTMLLQLVPKYGPLSIEMSQAMVNDNADFKGFGADQVSVEVEQNANSELIDIEPSDVRSAEMTDEEKAEIIAQEQADAAQHGPDY